MVHLYQFKANNNISEESLLMCLLVNEHSLNKEKVLIK